MIDERAVTETIVRLLSDLIAIPSAEPPGDSRAIARYAADRLATAGYAVEVAGDAPGIDNVVARLGQGRPSLVFSCHVDTVAVNDRSAWATDPFAATLRDGCVFGLGAGNAKGSMAAQIWAAEAIARAGGPERGEVVFTFVGDEERLGPHGLKFLRDSGRVRPDWLVVGGQTDNHLIVEERGVLWLLLSTAGRAAHAGAPDLGDNAILRMVRLLDALDRGLAPLLSGRRAGEHRSTCNVGRIQGGTNANVVPDRCVVEIDRRLLAGETMDAASAEIEGILAGAGEPFVLERITGTHGFSAPRDGACVSAFRAAIEARLGEPARFLTPIGVGDGRWLADDGIEILDFGPGSGSEGHAANESVPVRDLLDAALIQLDAVRRLLGLQQPGA